MARLIYKIALTYLLVVLVFLLGVLVAVAIRTPIVLEHHIETMDRYIAADHHLEDDLRRSFSLAVREILFFSITVSVIASILVTIFLSRRLVVPIKSLSDASRRIADGQYEKRVAESGNDELTVLARSFNRMAENLESTERRRMNLIGDAAHELRTPLTGIISVIEGISDGVLTPDSESLNDVLGETKRMKRLIKDLEELSRLSSEHVEIKRSDVDLVGLILSVIRKLTPQFEGKGVRLEYGGGPSEASVSSDPIRVTQILQNLLNNALRYTPENGLVRVTLKKNSSDWRMEVADDGIGIPRSELSRIFERFYRIDPSRNRRSGGSGIGLAVSRRLAQLLGGDITAESDGPGLGSTFALTLPADSAPSRPTVTES